MGREGRKGLTWGQWVNLSPAESREEWGWGLVCGVGRGELGSLWRADVDGGWDPVAPQWVGSQGWSRMCPLERGGKSKKAGGRDQG